MTEESLKISEVDDGVTFAVRVSPRAKRNIVSGLIGGALKVHVSAPPEDGRANDAVLETLADWLGVKRRQVELVSGVTNRNKVIRVSGITLAHVLECTRRL